MDLYAQPIPPEMAVQSSRVNLREALMQRLSEVQQQKQPTPKSNDSPEAQERSLLIEMLEKAQKLQTATAASWQREKQELVAQVKRLESMLKAANDERVDVKSDTSDVRKGGKSEVQKPVRTETTQKPENKTDSQLKAKVAALEKKVAEVMKTLEDARGEIDQYRFIDDERKVYIESLEEQLRVKEKPKGKTCGTQTEEWESEKERAVKGEMEAVSSQVAGLHNVIQQQQEMIMSLKAARAASKPPPAATTSPNLLIPQLLAEFEEQSLSFLLIKQEITGLSSLLQTFQSCFSQPSTEAPESNDELITCKQALSATVVCVIKLKELVREITKGKVTHEDAKTAALKAEIEMLQERNSILAEDRSVHQSLQALLDPVSFALKSCLPALDEAEAMKDAQSQLLSDLHTCVTKLQGEGPTCTHIDQIEELAANLKILQDEFRAYKDKVAQDKKKFSEQLFKIAESLEYRKDLWDQLQNLEADEDQYEKLGSLSEELERQSEWESSNLALLITWMQETPHPDPPARPSISTIPEEAEDAESDDSRRSGP